MLLKIKELRKFLSSISKYKVENIEIKSKEGQITINSKKETTQFIKSKMGSKVTSSIASTNKVTDQQNKKKDLNLLNKEQSKYFTIISPMIGTFYRSPAPNESPFIEINDTVQIDQTVCIIEAMKLMNEIESEVDGQIVEILVEDGDIVDCGQALIKIKQN